MVLPAAAARAAGKKTSKRSSPRRGRSPVSREHPSTTNQKFSAPAVQDYEYAENLARNRIKEKKSRSKRKKEARDRTSGAGVLAVPPKNTFPTMDESFAGETYDLIGDTSLKLEAAKVTCYVGFILANFYLAVQLPLYTAVLTFFVFSIFNPIAGVLDFVKNLVGSDVSLGPLIGVSIGLNGILTGFCWSFMFFAWFMYAKSGVYSFTGEKGTWKFLLFAFAFVMYGAAFFQFLPWMLPWMILVTLYPR